MAGFCGGGRGAPVQARTRKEEKKLAFFACCVAASYPCLPAPPLQGMMSGDLEHLLAQGSLLPSGLPEGGAAGLFNSMRAPSFNIGKLESLNLPDDVLAAALGAMERAAGGQQHQHQHQHQQHQQQQGRALAGPAGGGEQPAAAAAGGGGDREGGEGGRLTPQKRKA